MLATLSRRRRSRTPRRPAATPRLTLEPLEGRTVPSFVVPPGYPQEGVGLAPAVATGDFNHDGKLDLVTENYTNGSLGLSLGNGDGTFQPPRALGVGAPCTVAVADFNGDGNLDLVTSAPQVFLGKGDGSFSPINLTWPKLDIGGWVVSVAVGDFNGDGKPDIAATAVESALQGNLVYRQGHVFLWLGSGNGKFKSATTVALPDLWNPSLAGPGDPSYLPVVVGDFTGDGKLDVVTATPTTYLGDPGAVYLLAGNGDGTFQAPARITTGSGALAVGDFNRDGRLDLVVTGGAGVTVLPGNGNGTFQPGLSFATGSGTNAVAVGDFNHDGKLDIVTANGTSNSVSVLQGNGDGTFQAAQTFAAGADPTALVVGDLNGDGYPDLAAGSSLYNSFTVLLNNRQW
jgi:hypothetical protein